MSEITKARDAYSSKNLTIIVAGVSAPPRSIPVVCGCQLQFVKLYIIDLAAIFEHIIAIPFLTAWNNHNRLVIPTAFTVGLDTTSEPTNHKCIIRFGCVRVKTLHLHLSIKTEIKLWYQFKLAKAHTRTDTWLMIPPIPYQYWYRYGTNTNTDIILVFCLLSVSYW